MTDYLTRQKVLMTIELEDKGQDFIELDLLENGVLLGNSVLFKDGRLTLVGIGTLDGVLYRSRDEILTLKGKEGIADDEYVYFKETEKEDPLPWEAKTFKYCVKRVKKAKDTNRFISK